MLCRCHQASPNIRELSAAWQEPQLSSAERHQRIVEERGAVGPVGRDLTKEGAEQVPDHALFHVAGDEHEPRAMVVVGPALEPHRRVQEVLNPVDDDRLIRSLR